MFAPPPPSRIPGRISHQAGPKLEKAEAHSATLANNPCSRATSHAAPFAVRVIQTLVAFGGRSSAKLHPEENLRLVDLCLAVLHGTFVNP